MPSVVAALGELLSRATGDAVRVESLSRTEGGFSRRTYRCVVDQAGRRRTLALRVELEASVLPTDLEREWRIMTLVQAAGVPGPAVVAFEPTGRMLEGRFIAMEWVEGTVVNPWRAAKDPPSPETASGDEALCRSWLAGIARLHALAPETLADAGIDAGLDAAAYTRAEVNRWCTVTRTATRPPGALVELACRWLEDSIPARSVETTVVHGDLRLGNMLVRHGSVAAFLDWEMAGVGDWRADVGYSLMPYHAGKLLRRLPPSFNGLVEPRRFLSLYEEATGRRIPDDELVFYVVLGCVKMIAILCTGIDAAVAGRSSDPRMGWLSIAVPGLIDDATELIERGLSW